MQTLRHSTESLADMIRALFEAADPEAEEREKRPSPITPILLTLASPFIALLYLIFLPLVGFGMLFWMLLRPLFGGKPPVPPEGPADRS